MGGLNIIYVAIGALSLLAGLVMLVRAIRGRPGEDPRSSAMLIAGMMAAAFGLLMAGFAIAYATAENPR
jgi:hypothetical protein